MNFSSINIQGNIISSEILDKIRSEDNFHHQKPEAFGLARGASLRDEIGLAWSLLRTHWQTYKKRLETMPEHDTGTSLTRKDWILPLLNQLGYEVAIQSRKEIDGKSYAISHGATNRNDFPVHIMGYKDNLDKRRETGGPRLSPHALVQEYLNNTEHLFALVTNGKHLRLLRDATRLVRMSYLEFDLERMMEEELYADFSILYRVLHVSRMPEKMDEGPESVIEFYHQESLASGSRIREKLSEAVEESIKTLANGFLLHSKNEKLLERFSANRITADNYYMQQLRLVYRILFLIVLEERQLIYPAERDEETDRLRKIYFNYYSIERLRKLTENHVYVDSDKMDLWQSLKTTFLLFEEGTYGAKLGIKPLGSGIFSSDALGMLSQLEMSNRDLLKVLRDLTTFYNDQKQLVRVNYSDLDVEEFGSVYEGLLEYDPKVAKVGSTWEFSFVEGDKRSSSGSHYTPEELVKPLIKHSLDYIIEERVKHPEKYASSMNSFSPTREEMSAGQRGDMHNRNKTLAQEQALLSITVCDVACGSGHILLSAARKIATELASIREGAEQPSPAYYRTALRDVIKNCIYGVDYNPLAVELCKVALWLEAHNPGEPLNFLDHHIKCGNSIVGLAHREELEKGIASEAFKTLPGDEKDFAKTLRDQNIREQKERKAKEVQLKAEFEKSTNNSVQEAMAEYKTFNKLPETTPVEIELKQKAYDKFINGKGYSFLKAMADTQIAQFFTPKTTDNKNALMTDAEFRLILSGWQGWQDRKVSNAAVVAQQKRFFHWFIEFPTVMQKGGFDCIVGNPPYLGGSKISGTYGNDFLNYEKYNFPPVGGQADFVTYFLRRNYDITCENGFVGLITTNTICQGDTRIGGLDEIIKSGTINFAIKSKRWPGEAVLEVSIFTITKGAWLKLRFIDTKQVEQISSYFDDEIRIGNPLPLNQNQNKSFKGSDIMGAGFILTQEQTRQLINKDKGNERVIQPFLNGSDLNNSPDFSPSRYIINFFDWTKEEAERYPDCFNIIKELVYPERQTKNRKRNRDRWWLYCENRPGLYNSISNLNQFLIIAATSKTVGFGFVPKGYVYSKATIVFPFNSYSVFLLLQSSIHNIWAWKYGSTMKTDLSYTSTDIFETFPFPNKILSNGNHRFITIGDTYHSTRKKLMLKINLGLTKTYNSFHQSAIKSSVSGSDLNKKSKKEITKQYGKETWNLWNHLQKTEGTCSWEEAVEGIEELRRLHVEMDNAVLEAYGWHEDTEKWGKAINLNHDFTR